MKKLAVVFPGVGYTKDRPLLYYSGKLAVKNGYELIHIDFSGLDWSKEKLKDQAFLKKMMETCLLKTEEALEKYGDLSDADAVFISKSIGTVVAAAYEKKKGLNVKQIMFSPLEFVSDFIKEEGAVLFYGDADPYAGYEAVEKAAEEKKLEKIRISGGNHSLETGDILKDIDNLGKMMRRVGEILSYHG